MSDEQFEWLKDSVKESESAFKIIVHSLPISDLSSVSQAFAPSSGSGGGSGGGDPGNSGTTGSFSLDASTMSAFELSSLSWSGYIEQRDEILDFINEESLACCLQMFQLLPQTTQRSCPTRWK